ncbi:MAG: DUF1501 domain-containing protein [Oligoflexia bacterium]|nr:DUF1501 domain-containing protein [Oligoflexia bacterium]
MLINRRGFLKSSLLTATTMMLPMPLLSFAKFTEEDPHFFLFVNIFGGADPSYLFDARPLSMTSAGKIQNYLGEESLPFVGSNGTATLMNPIVKNLASYKNYFSVVNGVLMANGFEGHDQNFYYLHTGSPFGGDSFIPHLSKASLTHQPGSLDAIESGPGFLGFSNGEEIVPLDAENLKVLKEKFKSDQGIGDDPELDAFLHSRMQVNAEGRGKFSEASRLLELGHKKEFELKSKIMNLSVPDGARNEDEAFIRHCAQIFRQKIARSAVVNINGLFDTHAGILAKEQPTLYQKTSIRLEHILQALIDTPYDDQRSLMDVTTFMITSEFSRTMRQPGFSMEETGTDHNPLNNSVLVGGKKIKAGQVIGASDFASTNEVLSLAHKKFDEGFLKVMGRPFDFSTMKPRKDLPQEFHAKDYLSINSIVNTIYSLFDVQNDHYRLIARNEPIAPVLTSLRT